MQITDILNQTGGLQSIARELGISESEAASGAAALAPAILGGLQNKAQDQAGVAGLGGLLGQLGGGGLLDNVVAAQPTDVSPGNQILGHIFGSKDVSRTVAQDAAAQSGVQPTVLKKMLPMLTMLLAGYLVRQGAQRTGTADGAGGGLGSILGGILGGGGLGGALGGILGGRGGAAGATDASNTGGASNPLNDILGMGRQ